MNLGSNGLNSHNNTAITPKSAPISVFQEVGSAELDLMVDGQPPELDLRKVVGTRIRQMRRMSGFTQEQLAERSDRSVDAISALERGLAFPSFETLERLAAALDAPLGDLFGHDKPGDTPTRSALITRLIGYARGLSEDDLLVAVEQIAVLSNRSSEPSPASARRVPVRRLKG